MQATNMKNLDVYTDEEKALLGRKVQALTNLSIPAFTVYENEAGEIVDFGSQSGDPIVDFGAGRKFVCTWRQVGFKTII